MKYNVRMRACVWVYVYIHSHIRAHIKKDEEKKLSGWDVHDLRIFFRSKGVRILCSSFNIVIGLWWLLLRIILPESAQYYMNIRKVITIIQSCVPIA